MKDAIIDGLNRALSDMHLLAIGYQIEYQKYGDSLTRDALDAVLSAQRCVIEAYDKIIGACRLADAARDARSEEAETRSDGIKTTQ